MPTLEKYLGEVYLWEYLPNLPAAISLAIVFSLLTLLHTWKIYQTRLYFCIPFAIGGLFEVIGFTARATATNHTGSLAPFLLQGIFLLLPPVLFAASMYMLYARIVRAVGREAQSPASLRWATRIFIAGDLVCLNVQSSGGGLLGNDDARVVQIGTDVVIAGLALQVGVFVGFIWCCLVFHRRFRKRISSRSVARPRVPWETMLYVIYATSMAILFRNVFRVVEFGMGKEGVLQREEWPVYAFDAVPMVLVMVAYIVWHPGALFLEKDRSSGVELVGS